MNLVLDIVLPFGRYCATPWGRHVNEGAVEWPPSPWRIVRALVSSWHVHHPSLEDASVVEALELLCSPPRYCLPPHTTATTRHYLPTSELPSTMQRREPGTWKTSLGLNSFVAVTPGSRIQASWASTATDEQLSVLQRLASTVSYVGRAESRAQLRFSTSDELPHGLDPATQEGVGTGDVVDLLVPTRPLDLESTHQTTGKLHARGRTVPPGTTWVTYPATAEMKVSRPELDRPKAELPRVIQFTVSGRAHPTMDNAALLAGLFRAAVTSMADDHPQLHGHVGNDGPRSSARSDNHRHSHYLVVNDLQDEDGGRVGALVIWTPEGIPLDAVQAIARLAHLRVPKHLTKRLGSKVDLALVQVGTEQQLAHGFVAPCTTWRTLTPVTTVRHRKGRQTPEEFIEDVVRRELAHRGLPARPDELKVFAVPDRDVPGVLQARRTYRARTLGRERQHLGFHVRLEFVREVPGPLVLGSLAHFGLGLFVHERAQ